MSCSCTKDCVVTHNCCEDFHTECSENFQNGLATYSHMMPAQTTCSPQGYVVIHSCPDQNQGHNVYSLQSVLNDTFCSSESSSSPNQTGSLDTSMGTSGVGLDLEEENDKDGQISSDFQKAVQFIKNYYVTDHLTGFVYRNMSIFQCNARPGSIPVAWDVLLKLKDQYAANLDLATSNLHYYPPKIRMPQCRPDAKFCNDSSPFHDECLQKRCEAFGSPVTDLSDVIYGNRFCLECNGGPNVSGRADVKIEYPFRSDDLRFSALVSLGGSGIMVAPQALNGMMSWSSNRCTSEGCEIQKCYSLYTPQPDGSCVINHTAWFAVGGSDLVLTPHQQLSTANLFSCYLRKWFNFVPFIDWDDAVQFYKPMNSTMYLLKGTVLIPYTSRYLFPQTSLTQNLSQMLSLTKAVSYVIANSNNTHNGESTVNSRSCNHGNRSGSMNCPLMRGMDADMMVPRNTQDSEPTTVLTNGLPFSSVCVTSMRVTKRPHFVHKIPGIMACASKSRLETEEATHRSLMLSTCFQEFIQSYHSSSRSSIDAALLLNVLCALFVLKTIVFVY